jgi:division protein CdvB (Snf7/Vps24/ESCRT-III family)
MPYLLPMAVLAHLRRLLQELTLMCPQEQAAMRLALGLLASAAMLQRQLRQLQQLRQQPQPMAALQALMA